MSSDPVSWPALERMFQCRDYGVGFWAYVSPHYEERIKLRQPPPSDGGRRWSARVIASDDGVVSGELEAR